MNTQINEPVYIALAQINWKDGREEAVGIEKGLLDFEWLAKRLMQHFSDCLYVRMFDNKLNLVGIYYKAKLLPEVN